MKLRDGREQRSLSSRRSSTAMRIEGDRSRKALRAVVALAPFFVLTSSEVRADEPAIEVVESWFAGDGHIVHVAAVIRNSGPGYVGNLMSRVRLSREGDVYFEMDREPIKTVLAPGEETVVADFGPMWRAPDDWEHPPDDVEFLIVGDHVRPQDYPYAQDPEVVSVEVLPAVEGTFVRLSGELRNNSNVTYRAGYPRGSRPEAIKAVMVLYSDGKIVGAERLGTTSGHLESGSSLLFVDGSTLTGMPDASRIFTAAEPLEHDSLPLRLSVWRVRWGVEMTDECGLERAPCRRLIIEVDISNDSDVDAEIRTHVGLRLSHGRLWTPKGCPIMLVKSGETTSCRILLSGWWPTGTEFVRPMPSIDDIQFVSVHTSSWATTRDPAHASMGQKGLTCYLPQRVRTPHVKGAYAVFLPFVQASAPLFCTSIID